MRNVAVTTRLLISFGALAGSLIIFAAMSFGGAQSVQRSFEDVLRNSEQKRNLATRLELNAQAMRAAQRGLELYTAAKRRDKVEAAEKLASEKLAESRGLIKKFEALGVSPEEGSVIQLARGGLDSVDQYLVALERLCDAGNAEGATQLSASYRVSPFESLITPARQIAEIEERSSATKRDHAENLIRIGQLASVIMVIIAFAMATFIFVDLRRAVTSLRQIASELLDGSRQVENASAQIASSAQALAQGASEQAASLEETSSSAEQVNSTTQKSAVNSQNSAQLMSDVSKRVIESNGKVEGLVVSMKEINISSERISKIMSSVDEIAFQTNILALNAAIEAARAGEAGAGFAVVADEVRNLSQRCANAAKETAVIVQDSLDKCRLGAGRLDEMTSAIEGIMHATEKAKELVDGVHDGSREQARGLDLIHRAIAEMENVTQKNAATAEESAAAGEELSAQAVALREIASRMQTLVGGNA